MINIIFSLVFSLVLINLNKIINLFGLNNRYIMYIVNKMIDYVSMFETLIHEIGHSLISMLNGGESSKMIINSNGSGKVTTKNLTLKGATKTLLSGYTFSALFFVICLILIKLKLHFVIVGTLILFLLFGLLLIIRNLEGIVFSLISTFILFIMLAFINSSFAMFLINFIVIVSIVANVKSLIILINSCKYSDKYGGDCEELEKLYSSENEIFTDVLEHKKSFFYDKKKMFFANFITTLCVIFYIVGLIILIII